MRRRRSRLGMRGGRPRRRRAGPSSSSLQDVPEPDGRRRPGAWSMSARRHQLRRCPDPARALPADAGAADGARLGVAGELDGNRVLGFVRVAGGGYAERVAVDPRWLLPLPRRRELRGGRRLPDRVPDRVDPAHAAPARRLRRAVLVTAAAGAVGTAAIQLVKVLNGAPVAAVGSEEKLELPRSLGAVEAVTYDGSASSSRSTPSSTSSAARSSRRRSRSSSRSEPRSRSATPAGSGRT